MRARKGFTFLVVVFAMGWSPVATTHADLMGGVFTADVNLSLNGVFNGDVFSAVINPDADHPDKMFPTNQSGLAFGSVLAPSEFQYLSLPVYAIVDGDGNPWQQSEELFDNGDFNAPLYQLQHIANLTMSLQRTPSDGGGFLYLTEGNAIFEDLINNQSLSLAGTVDFDLPPGGLPNYAWYGLGPEAISFEEYLGGSSNFMMYSNDLGWSSGWPGTTLDKNFFGSVPVPEPATLPLVGLALLGLIRGRRRREAR